MMPRGSSIELAREMVNEVDKNNDGRVDYAEVGAGDGAAGVGRGCTLRRGCTASVVQGALGCRLVTEANHTVGA